jgi:phage gpG-like protein
MSNDPIRIEVSDEVQRRLAIIARQMGTARHALEAVGEVIIESVQTNFEAEGRPQKWKEHSDMTKARRGVGATILRDKGASGGLFGSLHRNATDKKVIVSTNKKYAAMQHFGARKGEFGTVQAHVGSHTRTRNGNTHNVRAHTRQMLVPLGDIPARPFMMLQDEDEAEIMATLDEFIFTEE